MKFRSSYGLKDYDENVFNRCSGRKFIDGETVDWKEPLAKYHRNVLYPT
jgi:hypothetical protein